MRDEVGFRNAPALKKRQNYGTYSQGILIFKDAITKKNLAS